MSRRFEANRRRRVETGETVDNPRKSAQGCELGLDLAAVRARSCAERGTRPSCFPPPMTKIAESLLLSYVVPHCLVGTPGGPRAERVDIAGDDADGGRIANGAERR